MIPFRVGQEVLVVEHDETTRQPKPDGIVRRAVVTEVNGHEVWAAYCDDGILDIFWAETGWRAWDGGEYRWKLTHTEEH